MTYKSQKRQFKLNKQNDLANKLYVISKIG